MKPMERRKVSALSSYKDKLEKVRTFGLESKLSETEISSVMEQCMQSLIVKNCSKPKGKSSFAQIYACAIKTILFLKKVLFYVSSILVVILIMYVVLQHKPTQYFIQSKLQDFIYPGMKVLRKISLPIISLFPSLTGFYDESCLVVNPFFRVPDMPCPCEDVRVILNLTGEDIKREQYHSGIPFMIKVKRAEISLQELKALYGNHSSVFDRDASYLTISSPTNQNLKSTPAYLFESEWYSKEQSWNSTHVLWRCNRMEPTRLLRSCFGVPEKEPIYAAGVTIEKVVLMDGPRAPPYHLPTTEGTTVFIQQSMGSRMIVLNPANECKEKCSSVSVELPPKHILWFSWWYWRASSLPSPAASSVSVSYVGSYL
ncbi:Regulatory protein E2 [Frankliniella fusca]|uniref:Regulatory protein E2 n=1 Tax=Frankliniella fusca TaxID=407009 RepID=A0AAE1HU79_9NEOP|nr:Regulatory protein E2 [Frankliniella fusca]